MKALLVSALLMSSVANASLSQKPWPLSDAEYNQSRGVIYAMWKEHTERRNRRRHICFPEDTSRWDIEEEVIPLVEEVLEQIGSSRRDAFRVTWTVMETIYECP